MTTGFLLLLAGTLLGELDLNGGGLELRYGGELLQESRQGDTTPVKQFEIYCLLSSGEKTNTFSWLVDEVGGGAWPWPERFGQLGLSATHPPLGGSRMRLLHTHNETAWPLMLPLPVFTTAEPLQEDSEWQQGDFRYAVVGSRKVLNRNCWEIEVSGNTGSVATLDIEQGTQLLVRSSQRVFLGRGDRFQLKMELQKAEPVSGEKLAALKAGEAALQELQTSLKRDEDATEADLTAAQLELTRTALPALEKVTAETPWQTLAATIRNNLERQTSRVESEKELVKKYLGKKITDLKLTGLDGKPIDPKVWQDQIVVLHFWKYSGDPLTEPYGQVGYLDFLHNRCQKLKFNVVVFGVAVDPRLQEAGQQERTLRGIRELKSFFNLGYAVTRDSGEMLKTFGDPREINSDLPLWVVLAPDGTIRHYAMGHYEIQPNQGLVQLEAAIVEIVKELRAKQSE